MPLLSAAFKCSRNLVWESCSSFFSDCITFIYYIEDSLQVQRSFWIANYPKLNTKSLSERNQFDSFPGLLFDMPRLFSCNGFSLNFSPSQLFFIQRFPFGFLLFIIIFSGKGVVWVKWKWWNTCNMDFKRIFILCASFLHAFLQHTHNP